MLTQSSLKGIPTDQLRLLSGLVSAEILLRTGTPVNPPIGYPPRMPAHPRIGDFRVGQRVTFRSKRGMDVTITITRINGKSVSGDTDTGMGWRVSPGLCRAV